MRGGHRESSVVPPNDPRITADAHRPPPPTLNYATVKLARRRPRIELVNLRVRWLTVGGFLAFLAFHGLTAPQPTRHATPSGLVLSRLAVSDLARAINAFRDEYGGYPAGDGLAIRRALHGDDPGSNPRGIDFLSVRTRLNAAGVICDGWDNPLVFRPGSSPPTIYSTGANGIDESGAGDDILLSLQAPNPAAPASRPTSR